MSSDLRLARLGLTHLKDQPELLRATLEKQLEAERAKEDEGHTR